MIEYIKVERRSGTTTRCVEMVNDAVERGKSVGFFAPTWTAIRALPEIDKRAFCAPIGNAVAGRRFDKIIVDTENLIRRDREWLEGVLALRLSGPDARMTVFHT